MTAEEATCEELERFVIDYDPERFFQVGVRLPHREKVDLVTFLKNNIDVRQPPRCSSKEHAKAVKKEPPIMSRLKVDEVLFAYIVVAIQAVSLVLIRDDSEVQRPVYYVSKSLGEAKVRYLPLEKAILAVVPATRKLAHYFQSHTVVVLTQLPLKSGQVLADLVAEFVKPSLEEIAKELHIDEKLVGVITCNGLPVWKVYVDSAANQRGSGIGLVLISPKGITFEKSLRLACSAINNETE
ncbi:uncharacterized protein LOC142629058 [Castanea sativa]|uniref:uncharacterized protein LOC142629058 n=1 Tax=Castanea sativa TaxID=21020 RepID=UPI003F64E823